MPSEQSARQQISKHRTPRHIGVNAAKSTSRGSTGAKMHARDWAIVAIITLLYAALAFWNLGDTRAAENGYTTQNPNEQITFDFGETESLATMQFYSYSLQVELVPITIEISKDGTSWEILDAETRNDSKPSYGFSSQFCWQDVNLYHTPARYLRMTVPDANTTFFEMSFHETGGRMLVPQRIWSSCANTPAYESASQREYNSAGSSTSSSSSLIALFDEQDLVPELSDFMNSTYFDEIYHARTAYEMLHGLPWYENTHPPLGKVIIEASIVVLGMNPFAWRMPGTLAGVLMLSLMYLMGKLLFRRRGVATFATVIFAFDCMHYSQTRIATIDSFTLLFIMGMFYLLFRYVLRERTFDERRPLYAGALFGAGVFMGLACATKWIGFYAAVGAAIILFAHWIRLGIASRGSHTFWIRFGKTAALCVFAFLVIPFCIYFASFAQSYTSLSNAPSEFWSQQVNMLSYHTNLVDTHYFASPWYEWPLDIMPMWWFASSDTTSASTINTMGNPIIWWAGLVAIIALLVYCVVQFSLYIKRRFARRNCEPYCERADDAGSLTLPYPLHVAWLIIVCYLCLYVPWMLVPRLTFIYHYFACTPFLVLALAFWMRCGLSLTTETGRRGAAIAIVVFTVLAAAAFVFFFPVVSGLRVPADYIELAKWLPKWVLWHA